MPFYLEYTEHRASDVRSAVQGETREEAMESSRAVLLEAGCRTALLRWSKEPSTIFGEGQVVATWTDSAGWAFL